MIPWDSRSLNLLSFSNEPLLFLESNLRKVEAPATMKLDWHSSLDASFCQEGFSKKNEDQDSIRPHVPIESTGLSFEDPTRPHGPEGLQLLLLFRNFVSSESVIVTSDGWCRWCTIHSDSHRRRRRGAEEGRVGFLL